MFDKAQVNANRFIHFGKILSVISCTNMTPKYGNQQKTKAAKTKTVTFAALLSSP